MVSLRPGRSGEAGGRDSPRRVGEEWRAIAWPTWAGEPAESPGQPPALQSTLRTAWVLGGIGGRPGRSGEAGGRGPPRLEEQERRGGYLSHPLEHRKPAELPGEVPCPLRPGVGDTPGSLLFLEPKPHPPQSPGPFPALWVLSIGPAPHSQGLSVPPPLFFSFFPSSSFFFLNAQRESC